MRRPQVAIEVRRDRLSRQCGRRKNRSSALQWKSDREAIVLELVVQSLQASIGGALEERRPVLGVGQLLERGRRIAGRVQTADDRAHARACHDIDWNAKL